MDRILLTMGMVVYNEEKYVAKAIESLLSQTFENFVIIISDNASTDKTQQICSDYAQKNKRIVYIRQSKNIGTVANWRCVLSKANTPYFMLCAGHDKWHPQFVEKLLPAFEERDVVLSYAMSADLNPNGDTGKVLSDDYTTVNIEKPVGRYLYFLRNYKAPNIFFGIWRTDTLKKCDLNLKSPTADIILLEQAAFEGKFKQQKEILFWLRTVRKEETHDQMIRRQLSAAQGKPQERISLFSVRTYYIIYVIESIKIIFRKRYSLKPLTKIWLVTNIIFFKFIYPYSMFAFGSVLKTIIGSKKFSELKEFWHKSQYQK